MSLPVSIPLAGVSNFRDLGGWPTRAGAVRAGQVFRAAALAGLTAEDAAVVRRLGVAVVCDLRGEAEAAAAPFPAGLLPGVAYRPLPIEPSVGASLRDILATRAATGADARALMREAYVAYAADWAHRYRAIFELLVAPDAGSLLFHCSAGKDRTGFGAALILTALGVGWDAVMADYLATNRLWRGDTVSADDLPADAAEILLTVQPGLLEAAFGEIHRMGGFEAYAAERLGLGAERLDRLRARLVVG
ncbi:MAG: tyrosine-protein phosphatase [Acetobacteraceae bacterium]